MSAMRNGFGCTTFLVISLETFEIQAIFMTVLMDTSSNEKFLKLGCFMSLNMQ
jgi:hypothetical protein